MTIEEGLQAYLSAHVGLTALVSAKIYHAKIPQSQSLPAVTYIKIATDRPRSAVGGHCGLTLTTFQISVFALTKSSESAISTQVHAALLNYNGAMGSVTVQGSFCLSEIEGYDPETLEYYNYIDYQITT